MFRHDPAHSGVSAETLKLPLKPAWSYDTGALSIVSSAAVVKNTVYFGTRDRAGETGAPPPPLLMGGGQGSLYALDAATGKLKWRFNKWTDGRGIGWVDGSPAVIGNRIYFPARDSFFYCIGTDGKAIWRTDTGGQYASAAPTVVNGRIFTAPGALKTDFISLRADNGQIVWRTPSEGVPVKTTNGVQNKQPAFSYSSPAVAGSTVYTAAGNGIFYALNPANGDIRWKFDTVGLATFFSPTVAGGRVICVPGEADPHVYAVNAETGKEAWKFKAEGTGFVVSCPAATADTVFVVMGYPNQTLYAVNASDGKKRWGFPTGFIPSQSFTSSPAVAGGVVLVGAGQETQQSEPSGRLFALDAKSGKRIWTGPVARPIMASPSVSGHRVFVGTTGGVMHAYRDATFDTKSPKAKPPASPTRPKTPSAKGARAKAAGKKKVAGTKATGGKKRVAGVKQ
jgi:outer membrane protein assembly factor BamB